MLNCYFNNWVWQFNSSFWLSLVWKRWIVNILGGNQNSYSLRIICIAPPLPGLHTRLYGSAADCRSIQKTCALWKHGLTSKNTQSQLTYFCKSNINQTFTNGGVMIWGVRIAIFTEIRHLVQELITFLSIFGLQKWGILTARLNKSLSISTSIQWEGISVLKHAQNLHSKEGLLNRDYRLL